MRQLFMCMSAALVVGGAGVAAVAGDDVPVRVIGQDAVTDIDWAPDGTRAVVASEYGMAQIHSLVAGEAVVTLSGHRDRLTAAEYSPDGGRVFTGAMDGTVRVWRAEDGVELMALDAVDVYKRDGGQVHCLAVSPDGTLVAAGYYPDNFAGRTEDGRVRVWDTATGALVRDLFTDPGDGGLGGVDAIAFSPDGTRLVSGSYHRGSPDVQLITQWEVGVWGVVKAIEVDRLATVEALAYSVDGASLIAGGRDWFKKFDAASGEEVFDFADPERMGELIEQPGAMDLSPDGSRVVIARESIAEWDVGTGALLGEYFYSNGTVIPDDHWAQRQRAAAYSPNGAAIFSCGDGGVCRVRGVASGEELLRFSGNASGIYGSSRVGVLFGRRVLLTMTGTRQLEDGRHFARIWDPQTGLELTRFGHFSGGIRAVALSPNAREPRLYAATGVGQPASLFSWDGQTGQSLGSNDLFLLNSLELSGDGQWMVSASQAEHFWVYSAATGEVRWEIEGHPLEIDGMPVNSETEMATFSPDGKLVASGGSRDGLAKLWDLETGELVWELQAGMEGGSANRVLADFSPDGRRLVTTSLFEENGIWTDYVVRLWDTETGGMIGEGSSPVPDLVTDVQAGVGVDVKFAPGGRYFATGDQKERILLWDSERMEVVRELWLGLGARPVLQSIEFSLDGKELYAGGVVTRVWDVADVTDGLSIYGRVLFYYGFSGGGYWPSGSSDPEIDVTATDAEGTVYRTSAGARGNYEFGYLPEGEYTVVAEGMDSEGVEYVSPPVLMAVVDGEERRATLLLRERTLEQGGVLWGLVRDQTDGARIGDGTATLGSGVNELGVELSRYGRYLVRVPGPWFADGGLTGKLTIASEGYEALEIEVSLSEGLSIRRDVELTRGEGFEDGSVGGWVVDAGDGSPLEGATVTVRNVSGRAQVRTVETGAEGGYLVEGLRAGPYRVSVSLSPYHPHAETVGVSLGGAARVDVELERDANGEEGTVKLVETIEGGDEAVTVSWPAHWGNVVVERSGDLENWEVVEGIEGNAHVFAAEGERFYVRVRYEE